MYATPAQWIAQFGEKEAVSLTDRAYAGVPDEVLLADALERASAEIDGYLGGRYAVPLTPAPPILANYCGDIARYRLCGAGSPATEEIRQRYRDAVRFLEHVAAGRVTLGGMPSGAPVPSATPVRFVTGGRVFARDGDGAF
ncbi:gp436 family protein [Chitiniphilus eburneus]|uniref:gp436 family protein n=1 Tax=Chitiniphilus eburneus TaxID=2571148 RepID=UPI0035CF94CD